MTNPQDKRQGLLDALPEHPAPDIDVEAHLLRITGAVQAPAAYSAADLRTLDHQDITRDFYCEEGWTVPDQRWDGVLLGGLLDRARPVEGAGWVTFGDDAFSITLPLEEARAALIALELNGETLTTVHGGPMRLFVPGGACYTSIKWISRIEVTSEPLDATARDVAMRRIGRNPDE